VQYAKATGGMQVAIWVTIVILLGVLTWAILRSKAPAPELKS
jgi:hypothetical protein